MAQCNLLMLKYVLYLIKCLKSDFKLYLFATLILICKIIFKAIILVLNEALKVLNCIIIIIISVITL